MDKELEKRIKEVTIQYYFEKWASECKYQIPLLKSNVGFDRCVHSDNYAMRECICGGQTTPCCHSHCPTKGLRTFLHRSRQLKKNKR